MKTRAKPRVVDEDSPRYFQVELPDKGNHHMRFPTYSLASRLQAWVIERQYPESAGGPLYSGAMIGAFWWHRSKDLESLLSRRADHDEIDEWAESVLDELQDDGYTLADIKALATECDLKLADWTRSLLKSKDEADFSYSQDPKAE